MVFHRRQLGRQRFSRADIHLPEKLAGIGRYDFGIPGLGQPQAQLCFTYGRWPRYYYQGFLRRLWAHFHICS